MKSDNNLYSSISRTNNSIRISNSSGSPVSVLSSFNEIMEASTIYENRLSLLPTVQGKLTIPDQATATISLVGNYCISEDGKKPSTVYSLLFVDPDTLSPISTFIARKLQGLYLPAYVNKQAKSQMSLARRFYQSVLASPTSDLAVYFARAIESAVESGNARAVDEYFQSTELYKALDSLAVVTEISYLDNCLDLWTKNQSRFTFYLYFPDGDMQIHAPKFLGTLECAKSFLPSEILDLKKRHTVVFRNAQGQAFPVSYNRRTFSTENPFSFRLNPTFITKALLTHKIEDNEIVPILNGQIGGVPVLGVIAKQDLLADLGTNASWSALWHPKIFELWASSLDALEDVELSIRAMMSRIFWVYSKDAHASAPVEIPDAAQRYCSLEQPAEANRLALIKNSQYTRLIHQTSILHLLKRSLRRIAEVLGSNRAINQLFSDLDKVSSAAEKTLLEHESVDGSELALEKILNENDESILKFKGTFYRIYKDSVNQKGLLTQTLQKMQEEIHGANAHIQILEEMIKKGKELTEVLRNGEDIKEEDMWVFEDPLERLSLSQNSPT